MEMVKLYPVESPEDIAELQDLIRKFGKYTGSARADRFLDQWDQVRPKFVKVYPNDYRRVIETQQRFKAAGMPDEEAIMAAFEENAKDLSRVGGK
jgi:glutamate synthase (ferredoxin)